MSARIRIVTFILMLAVAAGSTFLLLYPAPAAGQAADQPAGTTDDPVLSALAPLVDVLRYLDRFYYTDVSLSELVRGAIDGALRVLDDPHTSFFPPSEYEGLQIDVEGTYTGIGMSIETSGEYVVVQTPFPGSPAERAGLKPGDRILKVDGKDVVGERVEIVGQLIRGPEGTNVTLTIQRGDEPPFDVVVTRERIQLEAVNARPIGDIGYIQIVQFYEGTGEKVEAAYQRLTKLGVKGIVLDLRNNPGGLLNEAVAVARVFVPRGDIVHVVDYSGQKRTYRARPHPPGPPLAVLVNQGSASASEIVAAAIQDNGAGILVGSRTFGKGTVQSIIELPDGSALKFTTAEYLTPQGHSIARTGLEPDVAVDLVGPAPGPSEPDFAPLSGRYVLERGSRGLEVEGLQQRLNYIGYDAGPVDGVFGARTQAALRAFQRDHGLPATGRLDGQTHLRLGEAVLARWRGQEGGGAPRDVVTGDPASDPLLARALELLRSGAVRPAAGGP